MIPFLIGLIFVAILLAILWVVLGMLPLPPNVRLIIELVAVLICLVGFLQYGPAFSLPHGRLG